MSTKELSVAKPGATAEAQDRVLLFTRVFNAPRDVVFRAWTEPEQLVQWWAPEGFSVAFLEMDIRPGGVWRKCMRSPEGTDYWRRGVYLEVVEPERLVFTYISDDPESDPDHETIVTITFADHGAKTLMTFRQAEFESVAARDSHQGGWTSCLQRFAAYVARA
ncbi:MAG: SRPBCC domain-containing protein [Betaproteobacteria bacterium]|nr:SRPBCC domain-containing protein [Betaproteobacteria bacterium]